MMPQTALQRHLLGSSLTNLTGEVKKIKEKKVRGLNKIGYKMVLWKIGLYICTLFVQFSGGNENEVKLG